jgi:hypothetical protein
MAKHFADSDTLLNILIDMAGGSLNTPLDLSSLAHGMFEQEGKFKLTGPAGEVDKPMLDFFAKLSSFASEDTNIKLIRSVTFVGVDQYYIVKNPNGKVYTFRYRVGANRTPMLEIKWKTSKKSTELRGEIPLSVKDSSFKAVCALLEVVCDIASWSKRFTVQQSGNIWTFHNEPTNSDVEVVCYKVANVVKEGTKQHVELLAEIEPLGPKRKPEDVIQGTKIIDYFALGLGITELRRQESVATIMSPKQK